MPHCALVKCSGVWLPRLVRALTTHTLASACTSTPSQLPGRNLLTLDLGHNKLGHKGAVVLAQVIVVRHHAVVCGGHARALSYVHLGSSPSLPRLFVHDSCSGSSMH